MCWWRTEGRRGLPWKPLALAAACTAFPGCISGPLQAVRSNAQSTTTGPDRTKTLSNLVELSAHDTLGPDLEYRVSEQYIGTLQTVEAGGISTHEQSSQSRPTAELVLSDGPLRWSQRFEVLDNHTQFDPGGDNHLVRTDMLEKFEWSPAGMPHFTGWVDQRTVADDTYLDQNLIETLLQVQQATGDIDYQYSWQRQQAQDLRSGVDNDRDDHTLRASWREESLDGRFNSTVGVFFEQRNGRLEGASTTTPGLEIFPLQGFSAIDPTPQIASLPANPALIDANDTSSAGINIGGLGSGGELAWNIGLRLPAGSSVDTLLLTTVDEIPSNLVNQFAFSVWASSDNTFWSPVSSSVTYFYDPVVRSFRMTIPPVTQPYLKIVNSAAPPAAGAVLVSEMRSFTAASVNSTLVKSRDQMQNATTSVSWRLNDKLTLGYDLLLQTADTNNAGQQTRDETRVENGIWALWSPLRKVDLNTRLSDAVVRDPIVQDESLRTANAVLSYHPIERLDLSTSYTNSLRQVNGEDNLHSWTAQTLVSAQLLDTLRADLTLERSMQDDIANLRQVDHWVAGVALVAKITPRLELTLGYHDDQAEVAGAGAAAVPNPSEKRTQMIWLFRPSTQLTLQSELDWITNFAGSGLDQRTRLDWLVFEDGALDVQLDLDRIDTQSSTLNKTDLMRALMRYTMTPRAYFELSFSVQDPSDAERTEIVALGFNFSS